MKFWFQLAFAVTAATLLIIGIVGDARDVANRTYVHAAVGDIIMPFRYDCDLGVLYNSAGVPMVDLDGLPIECYNVELDNLLYKMIPNPNALERFEKDPLTGARG